MGLVPPTNRFLFSMAIVFLLGVPNQHRSEGARDTLTDAGLLKGAGKSHHRYDTYVKVIITIRPVTIPVIIPVTICNSI